jgi:uncharacterized DUF497 family protein
VDVLYSRGGLEFVWDVRKAAANMQKHGIRFEQACEVFFDPLVRALDAGTSEDARDALVGETEQGHLLFVVHVERDTGAIRIISARPATADERRAYENDA